MSIEDGAGHAGGFADERFRVVGTRGEWVFPGIVVLPLVIALLTQPPHGRVWIGLALGAGPGAGWVPFDSPPHT